MSLSPATKPSSTAPVSWFVLALALGFASFMLEVFHGVDPRYSSPGGVFLGIAWLVATASVAISVRDVARNSHIPSLRMAATLVVGHVFYYHWLDQNFDGAPGAALALAWFALASVVVVEVAFLFRSKHATSVDEL